MPIDPNIPLAVQTPRALDPMAAIQTVFAIKAAQQEQAVRDLQLEEAKQKRSDLQALDSAFAQPGGRDAVLNALPGHLRPVVSKQFMDMDEAHAKYAEAQGKADEAQRNMWGTAAAAVKAHNYDPVAAQGMISDLKLKFQNDPANLQTLQQFEQALHANPTSEFVRQTVDPILAASPKQTELESARMTAESRAQNAVTSAARLSAEMPGLAAQAQMRQQEATGTQPMSPYQKAELAAGQQRIGLEAQRVGLERQRMQAETQPAPDIKPGSSEFKIAQDLAYGRMTFAQFRTLAAYNRNAALKFGIYAKAAELNPGFNPASFEMGFQFAKQPKVQQQLASLDNVIQAAPDLIRISNDASRTGVTAVNAMVNKAGYQIGSKRYTNFRTAQIAFADELSGALGYGSATDMSREMGFNMTDPNLSPANFASAINDVVLPFVDRKRRTMLSQMGVYGTPEFNPAANAPAGAPGAPAAPSGRVRVVGPKGETGTVPAGTTLPRGWRIVSGS